MAITLRPVESDADHEAWRQVHMTVLPSERCDSVAELRRAAPRDLWRPRCHAAAPAGMASPPGRAPRW